MRKILFICTGNICRSPAAESIFKKMIAENFSTGNFVVDSAGTFGMHKPTPPEKEMVEVAKSFGYGINGLSKKATMDNLNTSDLIICMDESNFTDIKRMISVDQLHKVHRFVEYLEDENLKNIPDPYDNAKSEYEYVFKLIEKGCHTILKNITKI